ncbi:hypothetical protein [Streptomyces demainii]|uniref:Wadjet protein JetD C-terminal domain-containing protein n=1 Tax=Streptomyces demainii TaxID=588122 RepID=A0ABT9KWQ0_9ACTN|nr:hypothetical protein [Streptomyces demainii]MDP9612873.1 hypothetical protein [Streptomyces demainii]
MTPAERMAAVLTTQTRRRVDFDLLARAADEGDSALLTSPLRRRILAGAAQDLAACGTVRLPAAGGRGWDHSSHPPLPRWVERLTPCRARAARPGPRAWVEALAFATRLVLSRADDALLSPINTLLRDRPDAEPVPIAERSYELYGDEKRLARIGSHRLVTAGLLSVPGHLRAFPAPAPLAMFELGPAPWMLIVENGAAFTSLRRILNAWPRRQEVGWLAYGGGDHLVASLSTCLESFEERQHPINDLLLYTDLDIDGLECAQLAAARAREAGMPPLVPAVGLYRGLLTRRPRSTIPCDNAARIRAATSWLPEPLATHATDLLLRGEVLRQEALPLLEVDALLHGGQAPLPQLLTYVPVSAG